MGPLESRNCRKYCRFHKDIGHDTNDYYALKNAIENLIKKGHLREFVKEEARENRSEPQGEARLVDVPIPPSGDFRVGMIFGGPGAVGTLRWAHEQYTWEARTDSVPRVMSCETGLQRPKRPKVESEVIGFTKEECEQFPCHNHDALVIEARIDNALTSRIMADNGSAVNIIFLEAFRIGR